jgi:hypothetical protein
MLVDMASVLDDDAIDTAEEPAEESMHVLGIELAAERRVADEVGEQHRHLPSLALRISKRLRRSDGWRRRKRLFEPKLGDGTEHLLAVTEKHAETFEVGLGQVEDDVAVDGVVAEHLFIVLEAEAA